MANCMEKYSKYDLAMYKKNIDNDIDIQDILDNKREKNHKRKKKYFFNIRRSYDGFV